MINITSTLFKLSILTATCLIVSMLFSSCGSTISICKRHYTKGYHVDYDNNNTAVSAVKAEDKPVRSRNPETVHTSKAQEKSYTINESPDQHAVKRNKDIKVPDKIVNQNVISQQRTAEVRKDKINTGMYPEVQTRKTISRDEKINNDYSAGVALSLLWIVVVGILILWLIGYLAIGSGLIHILLVVALVLFVLWLLRIV